jgi:hypothetical protein
VYAKENHQNRNAERSFYDNNGTQTDSPSKCALSFDRFNRRLVDRHGRRLLCARPRESILAIQPVAAVGFVEAHGLALILGVLFWRAASLRSWHLAAVAVHVLLGTANLVFWQTFIVMDMLDVKMEDESSLSLKFL